VTLDGAARQPDFVRTSLVSDNYLAVLGVEAHLGRTFAAADEPVAVISYNFWERQYGLDPGVLGRTVRVTIGHAPDLADRVLTIVGVVPREFFGETVGEGPEMWFPILAVMPEAARARERNFLQVVARRREGVTTEQAQAATHALYRKLLADEGQKPEEYEMRLESAARGLEGIRGRMERPLWALMAAVAVVLLIACANVATLLVARAAARRQEISTRLAVGAGRARLVRQMLTESMLLAALGGGLGLVTAVWMRGALAGLLVAGLEVRLDAAVLGFALFVTALSVLAFGLLPALAATANPKAAGRPLRLGQGLVAGQVALSLVLVAGAGLLLRSLRNLRALDPGFDRSHVLLVEVETHQVLQRGAERLSLYRDLRRRMGEIPGVRSASLSYLGPFSGGSRGTTLTIEGDSTPYRTGLELVSPAYFSTVGIRLLAGREFGEGDALNAPRVAVINEALARGVFGTANPIGRRMRAADQEVEIVGVVRDARQNSLRSDVRAMVFLPLWQQQDTDFGSVEIRAAADPATLAAAARAALRAASPAIEFRETKTLDEQVERTLLTERLLARLTTAFGAVALALACVGLYGVLAYGVERRTREIGIRMAVGASPAGVRAWVLREGLLLAGVGLLAGIPLTLWAACAVESFLYGLKPADPLTAGGAALVLLLVAAIASWLPARRAARVAPMKALRHE
jgi:predicted permease